MYGDVTAQSGKVAGKLTAEEYEEKERINDGDSRERREGLTA